MEDQQVHQVLVECAKHLRMGKSKATIAKRLRKLADAIAPEEIPAASGDEQAVFDYWKGRMKKKGARFTPQRRSKVQARLKDGFQVSDLKRAVDGCAMNPWNNGAETGKVYDDLELICRNATKVEQFREFARRAAVQDSKGHYKDVGF